MSKQLQEMTVKQYFRVAIDALGAEAIGEILGVGARTVHRYAADPLTTSPGSQSPHQLEKFGELYEVMKERGYGYANHGLNRHMRRLAGEDLHGCNYGGIKRVLPTIEAEQLADYTTLARYQQAIEENRPLDEVEALEKETIAEIQRTTIKYRENLEKGR